MGDDIKIKFGRNLRAIRAGKALTQQTVADIIGTQQPAYCRIESGESNITLKTIEKLSQALDVSPAEFFKD